MNTENPILQEAADRATDPEVKALFSVLLARSRVVLQEQELFATKVKEGRTRREGRIPQLSKTAEKKLSEIDQDVQNGFATLRESMRSYTDEQFLALALSHLHNRIMLDRRLLGFVHEDEKPITAKIIALEEESFHQLYDFIKQHGYEKYETVAMTLQTIENKKAKELKKQKRSRT